MRPPVIGFQQHHHGLWDRAALHVGEAMQFVKATTVATGTEQPELLADLMALRERLSERRAAARRVFEELQIEDPARFRRCVDGLEPWPDEDALTFTGRCNCRDQCFHRFAEDPAENYIGKGDPREAYERLVESPWFECKCPDVRPPCPVPGHPVER